MCEQTHAIFQGIVNVLMWWRSQVGRHYQVACVRRVCGVRHRLVWMSVRFSQLCVNKSASVLCRPVSAGSDVKPCPTLRACIGSDDELLPAPSQKFYAYLKITRAVQPVATCRQSPYLRSPIITVTSFSLWRLSHCDVIRYWAGHAHRYGRTNVRTYGHLIAFNI